MGTSFCSTEATSTSGGDGGFMAEELLEQEEAPSRAAASKPANAHLEFKNGVCVIVMRSGQFVTERDTFRARTQSGQPSWMFSSLCQETGPPDARRREPPSTTGQAISARPRKWPSRSLRACCSRFALRRDRSVL